MKQHPTACAGLTSTHLNSVCPKRSTCVNWKPWWETKNVSFNLCADFYPAKFARYLTAEQQQVKSPAAIGMTFDLFA